MVRFHSALWGDGFLDAFADILASATYSLAQILACFTGVAFFHLVSKPLAAFPEIVAGGLEFAIGRLLLHSELARSLFIQVLRDRQALGLLIFADGLPSLRPHNP